MKAFLITLALISAVVLVSPASASAATNAGVKPGSFWYGFDLAFEKINLFFTFNSEGKARKSLEYADERLAEAEAVAESDNTDAVKTAITNYESNIAFAAEKSKDVSEKERAEALLTLIADNTSKHQEILADVLAKVPDGAKEAITKAIEASKKGQEEAMRQVAELKGEVEQLKKEVAELKQSDDVNQAAEIENLKKEIEELKKKPATVVSVPRLTSPPTTPTSPALESWTELENKYFTEANQKGWANLIITNPSGEKRYYIKEGNLWVRKNSEAEIQQATKSQLPDVCKDPKDVATAEYCLELAGQRLGFPSGWFGGSTGGGSSNYTPPSYSPSTPSFSEEMRKREMCDLVNGIYLNGSCH